MKKTRCLIIGMARSGTTVTYHLVRGHPNVSYMAGELNFKVLARGFRGFTVNGFASENALRDGCMILFNALTQAEADENTTTLCIKTVSNSPGAAKYMVDHINDHLPDLKVILVERKDLVAHFGSRLQLAKTGIAHSWYKGWSGPNTEKVKINRLLLMSHVISATKTYLELDRLYASRDVLKIYYEDILEDKELVYREMLRFLNLPYLAPSWLSSKKVLPPPEEYINDYQKLRLVAERMRSMVLKGGVPTHTKLVLKIYRRLYEMFNLKEYYRKTMRKKQQ